MGDSIRISGNSEIWITLRWSILETLKALNRWPKLKLKRGNNQQNNKNDSVWDRILQLAEWLDRKLKDRRSIMKTWRPRGKKRLVEPNQIKKSQTGTKNQTKPEDN